MDNAIGVSPEGSTISIIANPVGEGIELIVRDEGRGLTDEQRSRAFDRFWRNSVDSNKRKGSGLGLAIVAQLATYCCAIKGYRNYRFGHNFRATARICRVIDQGEVYVEDPKPNGNVKPRRVALHRGCDCIGNACCCRSGARRRQ
jgi:hypothetical protein